MSYVYFDVERVIKEHDNILTLFEGHPGIGKYAELEGMVRFIQDDGFYPDFEDKLTYLVFSVARTHYFIDANKRSSIAIGAYFLQINGLDGRVGVFIVEMENIVLCVADDIISKDQLKRFIVEIVSDGELSEESKLMVIDSMHEYEQKEALRKSEERRARQK